MWLELVGSSMGNLKCLAFDLLSSRVIGAAYVEAEFICTNPSCEESQLDNISL